MVDLFHFGFEIVHDIQAVQNDWTTSDYKLLRKAMSNYDSDYK